MAVTNTQVCVIGGGPGGYAAAFLAADLGLDVTLIDKEENPGGVCLYRGCIPSKALLHISRLIREASEAPRWGIEFGEPKIDLDKVRQWKQNVVGQLTGGLGQLASQRNIKFIQGAAYFVDAKTVEVDTASGKDVVVFEHAVLATGSVPITVSSLSLDSPRVIDSTGALEMEDVPESMLVVGGGYIGLELGSVYSALGSKVSVVEMTPGLLPGADRDLVRVLAKSINTIMEDVMLNTMVLGLEEVDDGIKVSFKDTKKDEKIEKVYSKVLISIGRRPKTDGLGLETTKVQLDEKGFVKTDTQCRTHEPNIFAIGDIAGQPMLAHKASAEGRVAVEVIAGHDVTFEPQAIPAVVFTDPELAWCGITELEAKAEKLPVKVVRFPWGASGRATTLDRNDGMTKMLIDPETERLLGMGIVGSGAGELIAEGVLAIEMGAVATDIKLSIHPHPTLSETVMESAEVYFGESTHVFRPKRK